MFIDAHDDIFRISHVLLETYPSPFLMQCFRCPENVNKMDLTAEGNPNIDFLKEAVEAMKNLQGIAQLKTFQTAMGKGLTGKFEWRNLVPEHVRKEIPKQVMKHQA